jgi:hypothetical protein
LVSPITDFIIPHQSCICQVSKISTSDSDAVITLGKNERRDYHLSVIIMDYLTMCVAFAWYTVCPQRCGSEFMECTCTVPGYNRCIPFGTDKISCVIALHNLFCKGAQEQL